MRIFVGLDLGQKQDYTAIAIVERSVVLAGEIDYARYEMNGKRRRITG